LILCVVDPAAASHAGEAAGSAPRAPRPPRSYLVYDGATGELELAFYPLGITSLAAEAAMVGQPAEVAAFHELLRSAEVTPIRLPPSSPNLTAYAEPRLEHAPDGVTADPMPGNHDNVERVMNALFDPRRCTKANAVGGRWMADEDFGAFVTELKRRGYRTDSLYMQRALRNPDAWWVTPGMYALRRMQAIEATKGDKDWRRGSVIAQRLYLSLEDRLVTGLTVPSVLPPRFGWGMPWFRLSMTMDWTFSGEGRYRLRPIGYATTGCPLGVCGLALYGNVGRRVDDGATGEAGLTLAWRNTEIAPVLYGVELAGYADLSRAWRPRYEAAVIVSTHVRGGVGYAQDDSAFYAFLGIDDPIGMLSSFRGLLPPWP
jgi:hypothetical protein